MTSVIVSGLGPHQASELARLIRERYDFEAVVQEPVSPPHGIVNVKLECGHIAQVKRSYIATLGKALATCHSCGNVTRKIVFIPAEADTR